MAQRIVVQDGKIVYSASDPSYDVNFSVNGALNVTKQLNVGNDLSASGTITAPTDLIIDPVGSLKLSPGSSIVLNNVTWPTGSLSVTPGQFLGASGTNTLEFIPFIIAFNSSDTLSTSDLNTAYPGAQPGQSVIGPTVVYECVSSGVWRFLGQASATPVTLPHTQIAVGSSSNTVTSSSLLTFDTTSGTLTVSGPGLANISSGTGLVLNVESDTGIALVTGGNTLEYNSSGTLIVNGSAGNSGYVLTSQGAGQPTAWAPQGGGGATVVPLVVTLYPSSYSYFDGTVATNWSANINLNSPNVTWDSGSGKLLFNVVGLYKITIQATLYAGYPNYWPANLTQFGTQLYGYNVIGSNNSRHSTWTGATPQDFRGIQSNLNNTPNPQNAVYSDEYIINISSPSTYQPVGMYAASYTSSYVSWGGNLVVSVEFLG